MSARVFGLFSEGRVGMHGAIPRVAALLDIDGTIIHSLPCHLDAWRQTIITNGGHVNESTFFKDVTRHPSRKLVENFFPGREPSEYDRMLRSKIDIYRAIVSTKLQEIVVPGFHEFFESLKSYKLPVGIVTSLETDEYDFVLAGLGLTGRLDVVIGITDVADPKPRPMPYLEAAIRIGIEPSSCAGFEDSFTGIEAVNRASMKCVVVGTTLREGQVKNSGFYHNLYVRNFKGLTARDIETLFRDGR
ncbi:MAG: HAD family phosphatase [Candidatus Margulisiibacteriota bacterium]